MRVLVTGARGMVGTALCNGLRNLRDGKDRTRPGLAIDEVFEYDLSSTPEELRAWCRRCDFVFNLAGVNRPKDPSEFMEGNFGFASRLLDELEAAGNACPVMLASSVQATLAGRFGDSEYGRSKLAGEELFFAYGERTGAKVAVYRFPNLMGHSRPNYNSAVSTFCWAIANDEPYSVSDPSVELELLCVDDLVRGMFDLLEGREVRCRFEGVEAVPDPQGRWCHVPETHRVTLGEVVGLLQRFKAQPSTLLVPEMPEGSFAKKLYSLYLTYLPADRFRYPLSMNRDARGSFTELLRTRGCGQVSVNVSGPGVTKGEHWHSSKWELFVVVSGRGLIRERNVSTGELVEFEVCGERAEAVHMVPGWTHSITNLSDTEDLVTVMWANECFDPSRPDTFHEEV